MLTKSLTDVDASNSTLHLLLNTNTLNGIKGFWDDKPNLMHRNENDGDPENKIYGKRMPE
jgi:hypothetical protein